MTRAITCLAAFLALALAIGADEPQRVNDANAPAGLIGGYTIVGGERYGQKLPTEEIEGTTVRFAQDGIVVLDKEKKEVYAQTYSIDSSKKPWTITMKSKITPYRRARRRSSPGASSSRTATPSV